MSDLWERVERLLTDAERPSRYIDREWGGVHDADASYRAALLYPDTYEVGMANQALQILYARLNAVAGVAAERVFVPWKDLARAMRAHEVPLFTLESCMPVAECDLIGITLPYELTYTNVLEALDLAGVPLRAEERGPSDPLVVGGGPCAHNPEPIAPFFDAILIGEGEDAVVEIATAHRAQQASGGDRASLLSALAAIEGVYVPSLYMVDEAGGLAPTGDAPPIVRRRVWSGFTQPSSPVCPVVPYADVVHDRANVEVLRGCSRGCRFCQAGMVYRPVRERDADAIVGEAVASLLCTGYEEVSLTSLSSADHSQLPDVLRRLSRRLEGTAIGVSVPSLRVDAFTLPLARLLAGGRKGGLTFAPEAGSQRLRDAINKNVTEAELLATVGSAFEAGWRRVKLYFMLGLPTETDADVADIGRLVGRVLERVRQSTPPAERGGVRVAVSVSTFVPKAHTPFQWEPQLSMDDVRRRQAILRDAMPRRGVELSWHDPAVSVLEAVLARGDRSIADAIESAWRHGAVFDAWTEEFDYGRWATAFDECGVDAPAMAASEIPVERRLPWAHIDSGVSESFLLAERARARGGETTVDCTFGPCTGCGVCPALGVDVVLAGGDRRG